jgi:cobalt-zinc-cadmium efflux system membrane fusion protein
MAEFGIVVQPVGRGTLDQSTRLTGEVAFNADRIAHVSPSVPGIVQSVSQSVGDAVEAGDVMAVLSSRELASARSDYLAASARLALAEESLGRDERLLADRIGTERQVLEARQAVRETRIAVNLAEQNLHALGQDHDDIEGLADAEDTGLSTYELKAPLTGVVIARELTRGEVVSDEPAETPFVVADLSSVWVNLAVYQRDLAAVRRGTTVRIAFGPGIPDATGTIAFISPSLDEHTRTATARVVLDNPEGVWRPGMFVTAQATTASTRAGLVLPRSAIQKLDGQTIVFVQHDGVFEPRPVEIGRQTEAFFEILSGLEPGERVVTQNGFALKAELNREALEHAGHAH